MKLSSVFVCQLLIGLAYTEFDLSKVLKDPKEQRQETILQPKCVGPKCLGPDVVDVLIKGGEFGVNPFSTLLKMIIDLGLGRVLKEAEAVTVFVPPNFAFSRLPAGTIENLTPEQAKEIVLRHVVDSKLLAADVVSGPVKTMGGEVIDLIKTKTGRVQIAYEGNTIRVYRPDIMARNGVIHIIDKVIIPSDLGDVVEVAKEAGIFNTLLKIVTELGLVDTLKEAEAVTVFAPPDEAFAKLPNGTIESLTQDQAKEIVLRHVIESKVLAADINGHPAEPVETLGGETIYLWSSDGSPGSPGSPGVYINYRGNLIKVDKADVMARNGVIHIIPTVIFPRVDEKRLEKRMKRSAISKNYGNNCGTKRGPQPRHISETNEGPKSKELAPLGRNSLAMRTKDSLINAFQKLFG